MGMDSDRLFYAFTWKQNSCSLTPPVKPMLSVSSQPFDSGDYYMEIKYDGTRSLCFVDGDSQLLQNRKFVVITKRYPDIKVELKNGIQNAILDGEIVVMRNGIPSFNDLQHREHILNERKIQNAMRKYPACYIVFDVLCVNGKDVTALPLYERKVILKEAVAETGNVWVSDYVDGSNGKKFFELCVNKSLEGVMAKLKSSPYLVGKRNKYWLKIKKSDTIEAVVLGITEGEGAREPYFGAVILGCYDTEGKLHYIGKAGTGFKTKDLKFLKEVFKTVPEAESNPFGADVKIRDVKRWFKPVLVSEVEFMEITEKGKKMRGPRFKGLRDDKSPQECIMEDL